MPSESSQQIPPETAMMQMASGYWLSQCIYVAAKLGIADLLEESSRHCDALATATNTDSNSLYRVLRALASVGIFAETEPRCFQLTPMAATLQSNVPNSIRGFTIMLGEEHYQAWGSLLHSVQTGNAAFDRVYDRNIFEYLQQNPGSGQIFEQAMTELSDMHKGAILEAYDFSEFRTVVDVAGGRGSLLAAIVQKYPNMKGILFDEPYVIEKAGKLLEGAAGGHDRIHPVGGDFFKEVPVGGDAYILKHIIHDWDDEKAIAILQCCHQAMNKEGKLLVIDSVIPPGNKPQSGKLMDINMLVVSPNGRERTEAEFRELLLGVGFEIANIVPTKADVSVIEAVPVCQ